MPNYFVHFAMRYPVQDLWNTNVLSNNEVEKLKQDFKAEVNFKNNIIKTLEMSKMHTEDANTSTNNYYKLSNLFKSQNTELSKCNSNLRAEVFTKNNEITTLKERNTELEKINHDLEAEIESKNSKTKVLQEAIVSRSQDSKSEVKSLCSEITALEKLTESMRNELMKVKQDFKAEVESKNSEIKALEVSKMHIEDSNNSTINNLLIRNKLLQAKVDSKNSELKGLWENQVPSNKEIEQVNKDLKAEIASKHSEIKALRISKASATTEFEKTKSEMKTLNHYIKAFKHQNTELLKINDNLKAEMASKESEVKARKNYLLTKNNDLEKVKQELQAELDSKNSEIQALRNSWNDLSRCEIEKVKQDLKAKLDSKDSEIKVLQEWYESARNELCTKNQIITLLNRDG